MRSLRGHAAILMVAVLAVLASAATYRVEKDGSGDFTIIQDALDVAADGDTVLVGEGRFSDLREYDDRDIGGGFGAAIGYFPESNVSLVGLGRELSVVGPDSLVLRVGNLDAIGLHLPPDVVGNRVEGDGVENTKRSVNLYASGVTLSDCGFGSTGGGGIIGIDGADSLTVTNCGFSVFPPESVAIVSFIGRSQNGLLVRDSTFNIQSPVGNAIALDTFSNVTVERCSMVGGLLAIQLLNCENARIVDTTIRDQKWGLFVDSQGASRTTTITRCSITQQTSGPLWVYGPVMMEVQESILEGGDDWVVFTRHGSGIRIRNSHLLPKGAVGVLAESPSLPGVQFDLRENWWGTTDESQIESWIVDALDDATVPSPLDTVLFRPILLNPVESEASSMGALKSRFH